MDISAIALQGLQQAVGRLNDAAQTIATYPATVSDGANVDTVDLSAEIVALMQAQTQFAANIDVLKTADAIQQKIFDVIA
jgi:flagellar basal body rod protein FlgG